MIDYQKNQPIAQYLISQFSDQRFDSVIDAFGLAGLYSSCAEFLAKGKPFVTVGVANLEYSYMSMMKAVGSMLYNVVASLVPGDQHRRYVQVASMVNQQRLERLGAMMEEGRLRVPIDSTWEMEDALKVGRIYSQTLLTTCRHTRG